MAEVPKTYLDIKSRHPAFIEAVEALGGVTAQAGPLDAKAAHLIQLAAAAAIRSKGAARSHAKRAREAGATPEEIAHALILITGTVGFPAVAAALSWVEEDTSLPWISENV